MMMNPTGKARYQNIIGGNVFAVEVNCDNVAT